MNYQDLDCWKLSVDLVVDVYNLTLGFPVNARFNSVAQINRSEVSIPSNIAEGSAKR